MKKFKKVIASILTCSCFVLSLGSSVSFASTKSQGYLDSSEMQRLETKASQSGNLVAIRSGSSDDAFVGFLAVIGLVALFAASKNKNGDTK